jgi:ATP-dependent RNA helicase RhlE
VTFKSFNLDPKLLATVHALGYTAPTPIQRQSIPSVLAGKDVMGLAQTGTGKTAAFALPILQNLLTNGERGVVQAVIIAPTRELAQQIHEAFEALAKGTGIRSVTLYGGVNINTQIKNLQRGVEIVVACPGRLLDLLQQRAINFAKVKMLVLDEADQMFDMGFFPDIKKILRHMPKQRPQTLLFSATMPDVISELAQEVMHNPVKVQISNTAAATSVTQVLFPVAPHLKTELLIHILHTTPKESILVFTRTKHTAKKLAVKLLAAGFRATSLQGNLSQSKRMSAMKGFRDGSLQILVATDIASRGIDVASITHVINYDIPATVEAYIHRIGRTGRAAKEGEAFTLITPDNLAEVRAIERKQGMKIEQKIFQDFDYNASAPPRTLGSVATMRPSRPSQPSRGNRPRAQRSRS